MKPTTAEEAEWREWAIARFAAIDEVERRLKERANRITEATRLIEFLAHDESDVVAADARKWLANVKES